MKSFLIRIEVDDKGGYEASFVSHFEEVVTISGGLMAAIKARIKKLTRS